MTPERERLRQLVQREHMIGLGQWPRLPVDHRQHVDIENCPHPDCVLVRTPGEAREPSIQKQMLDNLIRDVEEAFAPRFREVVDEAHGDISVNTAMRVALDQERREYKDRIEYLESKVAEAREDARAAGAPPTGVESEQSRSGLHRSAVVRDSAETTSESGGIHPHRGPTPTWLCAECRQQWLAAQNQEAHKCPEFGECYCEYDTIEQRLTRNAEAGAVQPAAEPLPEIKARWPRFGLSAGSTTPPVHDIWYLIERLETAEAELARLRAGATPAQEWMDPYLRQRFWLGHGHTGQYGDDGEMQCAMCGQLGLLWDYRREPLERLRDQVNQLQLEALAESMRAGAPAPPQEPTP